MGWRIHFTAEDLARTRVGSTLGPLAETMFGLWMARTGDLSIRQSPWHEQAIAKLTPEMKPLLALLPANALGVDLWSLTGKADTIEQGLDALLAMQPAHVQAELSYTLSFTPLPTAVWAIADKDPHGRRALVRAAHASYRSLIEPHWMGMRDRLHAERMRKGRIMLESGLERLFTTLGPRVRWQAPVLELLVEADADIYLCGRGLTLVPSLLLGERPMLLDDIARPQDAPTLVFSAGQDQAALPDPPKRGGVAAVLGHTRAAILSIIGDGCTTSEVAGRVKISVSSASHQVMLLRQAGLISTSRGTGAALHTLTPLGAKFAAGA